jgi:hypothetical protein
VAHWKLWHGPFETVCAEAIEQAGAVECVRAVEGLELCGT